MIVTVIAAVRSLVTYVLVSLYVLVVGPIGVVLALGFKQKGALYALGHVGVGMALSLAGIRYTLTGRERVPRGRAVVFCSNHESNVDPAVLFRTLDPRLHVLYKAEMRNIPVLGRVLEAGEYVAIERDNRDASMRSIERAAESIRRGNTFLIFPEGTRSRTSELLPFKKGGFIMAIRAQAPIVPVAIHGGRAAMRKGSPIVRPVHVQVTIGDPVETEGKSVDDRDEVIALVRERIEAMLRQ